MEPLLYIDRLSLAVGSQRLLHEVSLSLQAGAKVAIVGANGAGKSSLLKTIAGLYRQYDGVVRVDGHEVKNTQAKILSTLVSFVPQRLEFVPRFTVAEFFEISGVESIAGLDSAIPSLLDRYLPDLSGGELQRVILAGAVAQGAKLLLLDEPTAHLDPTGRNEVERVISEYHEQQTISYLLVTHDISLALRAAEHLIVMKDAGVLWSGSIDEPRLPEVLEQAYGCSFTHLQHPTTGARIIIPG